MEEAGELSFFVCLGFFLGGGSQIPRVWDRES